MIGELLQKVGEAWAPVIDDGKNIALGIALGTALLAGGGRSRCICIRVIIGTGGAIPIAIAAGTAMLVLLGAAHSYSFEEIAIVR